MGLVQSLNPKKIGKFISVLLICALNSYRIRKTTAQKEADVKTLESAGVSSKATG
jgi:hypothetical protein